MTTERYIANTAVEALPEPAAPPAWFQRKRRGGEDSEAPPKRPAPVVAAGEAAELSWEQKLRRWLIGADAVGLAVSFILHLVLLVVLSFVLVEGMKGNNAFSTMLAQSEGPEQLETIIAPPEDAGGQSEAELPQMQVIPEMERRDETVPIPSDLLTDASAALASDGQGESVGDGEGNGGGGLRFKMPEGGEAVTKGSFTAWTVPEDPQPGENYMIVIQIRLPENIDKYPLRDLTGMVEGTDTYRQPIGGRYAFNRKLPVIANSVQVTVMVPGAAQLVRDKIELRSRLLKEEQTLEIVF
jgi:hypothetical protein